MEGDVLVHDIVVTVDPTLKAIYLTVAFVMIAAYLIWRRRRQGADKP